MKRLRLGMDLSDNPTFAAEQVDEAIKGLTALRDRFIGGEEPKRQDGWISDPAFEEIIGSWAIEPSEPESSSGVFGVPSRLVRDELD